MPQETSLTAVAARVAGLPLTLARRRPFHAPHKILILQPCCLSQVMLTTPLVAALGEMYPAARIDWAVGDWAKPAVAGNQRITELLPLGEGDLGRKSLREIGRLILRVRSEHYDTAFIPSSSSLLGYIAWQAGIHQRVGLNIHGRGFGHTTSVTPPKDTTNAGARGLLLAEAVGGSDEILGRVNMEFYPSDRDRTAVTRLLIEEVDWLGDVPLVIMHPGGGVNPIHSRPHIRWPTGRFVLLANHLIRTHKACILLVGDEEERPLLTEISGLVAGKVNSYCGRLTLAELGALCEVADLYIGNDTGPTQIAAASGCQTLAIYGPTDPAYSTPYSTRENVLVLGGDESELGEGQPFSWEAGVTVEEAQTAVDSLLDQSQNRKSAYTYLTANRP